jgi:hypothetical protein
MLSVSGAQLFEGELLPVGALNGLGVIGECSLGRLGLFGAGFGRRHCRTRYLEDVRPRNS